MKAFFTTEKRPASLPPLTENKVKLWYPRERYLVLLLTISVQGGPRKLYRDECQGGCLNLTHPLLGT
jgi:hypothetical protein